MSQTCQNEGVSLKVRKKNENKAWILAGFLREVQEARQMFKSNGKVGNSSLIEHSSVG